MSTDDAPSATRRPPAPDHDPLPEAPPEAVPDDGGEEAAAGPVTAAVRGDGDVWGGSEFDVPGVVDSRIPNIARVYDYWGGGKDNFAADRRLADLVRASVPGIVDHVAANREFLVRVVRELAKDGVDQFLDLGAGIPTSPNVHEVAHAVNPATRIVYVDNDPVVLASARALLAVNRTVTVVSADLREPGSVFQHPEVTGHLDWTRPVAVLAVAVLHFLTDAQATALLQATARALHGSLPGGAGHLASAGGGGGGVVVISHGAPLDLQAPREPGTAQGVDQAAVDGMSEAVALYNAKAGPFLPRTAAHLADLIAGWEYLPPGLVPVTQWRPSDQRGPTTASAGRASSRDPAVRTAGSPGPVPVLGVVARPPRHLDGPAG